MIWALRTFWKIGMADTWLMLLSFTTAMTSSAAFDDLLGFERLCNHPEKIAHGKVEVFGNGWLVTFTCDPGFLAIGEVLGSCNLKTGRWTIDSPFCVAKGCPRSKMMYLKNGRAHFLHGGAVVRFSCSPGFYLVGYTSIHCTGTVWSERQPECRAVEDPDSDNRSNGASLRDKLRRTSDKSRQKWAQIKNNFTSIQESDDTCMSRTYKVKVPQIPNSKSKIVYLKGRAKKYEWVPVVTYTCLPGYRFENKNNRHLYCKRYRYDAAIFPNCMPEINPCEVDNGNATCHQICKPNDVKYKCHCRRGYTLSKDGISCNDIDECNTNRGICGQNGCQNTVGSYICMCARPGYRKINNKCLAGNDDDDYNDSYGNNHDSYDGNDDDDDNDYYGIDDKYDGHDDYDDNDSYGNDHDNYDGNDDYDCNDYYRNDDNNYDGNDDHDDNDYFGKHEDNHDGNGDDDNSNDKDGFVGDK